ncbi:hypothetical protein QJS10_CPB13g00202 [Acorus calamus]|uniref:Uncharacterized protein n=1 Tax=Acorus calamus TaxID=4465 RepID=A0AAV9DJJ2_ACOCL|nr:hypothetical protein QJS10_CPB13g00202 [Acorus calamus]
MLEKLAVPEAGWPCAIKELCNLNHIEEAAVLSTSNRTEVYVVALSWHRGVKEVTEWMAKASGVSLSELRQHLFLLRDSDASRHLFEVSTGLESLILGESQIQSKVEEVVNVCHGLKGFGENIRELFEDAIIAGRRVHDDLSISSGAVSEVNDHKEVEFDEEEQLRQATKAQTIIMEAVKKFEVRRDQNQLLTSATVHNLNKYANRILESELKTFSQKIGRCDRSEVKKTVEIHMNNILRELLSGPCKHLTENHNLNEVLQNTLVTERVFKLETEKSVIEKKIRAKLEQSQT